MDEYTQMLEMQLRFAEEEKQEAVESAYWLGRADAIEELGNALCNELDKGYIFMNKHQILHFVEQLKNKKAED